MGENLRKAVLLLAGHGSGKNTRVGEAVRKHAEVLRQRGIFADVQECFWKEKPTYREALEGVQSPRIYIVSMLMGIGHFTREILLREFSLSGKYTIRGGKEICYCFPVGSHPNITSVILNRARAVTEKEKIPHDKICLLLVGHGARQDDGNAALIAHQHAAKIRALNIYGECQATFLEQRPFLRDWREMIQMPCVIVVPFFISNGAHVMNDIPKIMKFPEGKAIFNHQFKIQGKNVWYTEAVGDDPALADVILDQVRYFNASVKP